LYTGEKKEVNYLESSENVPIHSEQNVPFGLLVPCLPRRNNIRNKEVEHLAVKKFTECKKGITFKDLILKFGISKKQSQRKLKECRKDKSSVYTRKAQTSRVLSNFFESRCNRVSL
jgi:hypothetical protein